MERAEDEGGVRGWVEDEEGEAERNQQQRQRWGIRGSQVQEEEAALEGAQPAGEPAGGEAPREGVQAVEVQEEWGEWVGSWEGHAGEVAEAGGGLSLMSERGVGEGLRSPTQPQPP